MTSQLFPPRLGRAVSVRWLIATLAAPAYLLAGEPGDQKGRVTQESLTLVKKAFPYQPVAAQDTEQPEASDGDEVVQMQPFVVDESHLLIELDRAMARKAQKLKDERFTFTKGGLFYKNERIEIGASKHDDLFKGEASFKPVTPLELDLLRIKF